MQQQLAGSAGDAQLLLQQDLMYTNISSLQVQAELYMLCTLLTT